MPEGFLFDTVTCRRWRRGDRILRRRVEALPVDTALYTSVISVGELSFGIHNAPLRIPGATVAADKGGIGTLPTHEAEGRHRTYVSWVSGGCSWAAALRVASRASISSTTSSGI